MKTLNALCTLLWMDNGKLYIPEYSADTVTIIDDNERSFLSLKNELDAPAGVDVKGDIYAIADFYNHRIVYHANGEDLISCEWRRFDLWKERESEWSISLSDRYSVC